MNVLISGGGIAGSTLAYWLAQRGFHPTVVERSTGLRSSGSPVDVKGPAVPVAEKMGIMASLRAAGTDTVGMTFVNAAGKRVGRVPLRRDGGKEVELPRGALTEILYEASKEHAEYLWDDSILAMDQDEHGVNVTFDRSAPRRFDLVIGADGLHSNVRRLAFGPESDYVRHMGLYVATLPLDGVAENRTEVVMHNAPGKAVAISPVPDGSLAFFAFRAQADPSFNHRDTEQHRQMVLDAYADVGWRVPELLEQVRTVQDLYFDSVSQVRLPRWSQGRIALLGDAASCVSLFGDGSSMAMAGAYTLAEELAREDHATAFDRYERRHRKLVDPKQANFAAGAAMLIPSTRFGLVARNLASRLTAVGSHAA